MHMRKRTFGIQTIALALVLCLTLATGALAAGTTAYVQDDVWTINFYDQGGEQYATVTRLQNAFTSSFHGLTLGDKTYTVADALENSVLQDSYGKVRQASFRLDTPYDGKAALQVDTELLTLQVDNGAEKSYSRSDLEKYITKGTLEYSGQKDNGDKYYGIATEYITMNDLLRLAGVSKLKEIRFRPIDWEENEGYIRTLDAEQAGSAVLALKSYQSEDKAAVTADKADTMNAFRLIPATSGVTGFDSVKWVNHISLTSAAGSSGGGGGGGGTVTPVTPVTPDNPTTKLPFTDVSTSHWAYDAICYVYENKLFNGMSATLFGPDDAMTRAMLWTVLARADHPTTAGGSNGSNWYERSQAWVMNEGISDGTEPDAQITREQLVTMLWRYKKQPEAQKALSGYTDIASISDYAKTAMAWAVESGLLKGNPDGTLNPAGTATRAELATILMRFQQAD